MRPKVIAASKLVVGLALLVIAFLAVTTAWSYVQRSRAAESEVARLEVERDELADSARIAAARIDSLRALGDTLGRASESDRRAAMDAEAALETSAQALQDAQEVSTSLAERVGLLLQLDRVRVAQIDTLRAVARRDSVTIERLRGQLYDERWAHDQAMANVQRQLRNLELQVQAFRDVAEGSWWDDIKEDIELVSAAFTVGVATGAVGTLVLGP